MKLAFVVVSGLKRISVIVVLASALSACFTIRYDYVQAPQISGTLFDGANPLKHEYVILSTGVYRPFVESGSVDCKNVEAITTTDDAGNFEFQVVKRQVTVHNPWEYTPGAYWSVCIERDRVRRTILGQFGRSGEVPFMLRVRCNVGNQQEITIEANPPIRGYCEAASP